MRAVVIFTVVLVAVIHKCLCAVKILNGNIALNSQVTLVKTRCDVNALNYPGLVANVQKRYYSPGEVYVPVCTEDYELFDPSSNRELTCEDGQWKGLLPPCKTARCRIPPPLPEHGFVVSFREDHGANATYACEPPHVLEEGGAAVVVQCLFGRWTGEPPSCRDITCKAPPPLVDNARVVNMGRRNGSRASYLCDRYFRKSRSDNVTCIFGQWAGQTPVCKDIRCNVEALRSPGLVPDAGKHYYFPGEVYTPACNQGYEFSRSSDTLLKCEDGQWEGHLPPCKAASCTDPPPALEHGFVAAFGPDDGSPAVYECEPPHVPEEEGSVRCSHGLWTGVLPTCRDNSCRTPPPPVDNAVVVGMGTQHGSSAVYLCDRHFVKSRPGNLTCILGQWVGRTPACKDTRCDVKDLKFPGLVTDAEKRYYFPGEIYAPACNDSYEVSHPGDQLKCEKGHWKGHFPPCKGASCRIPPPPPAHHLGFVATFKKEHGSSATYECERPLVAADNGTVRCMFGSWTGAPPQCRDSRCYQKDIKLNEGIALLPDDITYPEHNATIACQEGYELKYDTPICDNGIWVEHGVSPCARKVCLIPEIRGGAFTTRSLSEPAWDWSQFRHVSYYIMTPAIIGSVYDEQTQYFVSCDSGFTFHGSGDTTWHIACTKGQWKPTPVCSR